MSHYIRLLTIHSFSSTISHIITLQKLNLTLTKALISKLLKASPWSSNTIELKSLLHPKICPLIFFVSDLGFSSCHMHIILIIGLVIEGSRFDFSSSHRGPIKYLSWQMSSTPVCFASRVSAVSIHFKGRVCFGSIFEKNCNS